jgi:hypothetical protein
MPHSDASEIFIVASAIRSGSDIPSRVADVNGLATLSGALRDGVITAYEFAEALPEKLLSQAFQFIVSASIRVAA